MKWLNNDAGRGGAARGRGRVLLEAAVVLAAGVLLGLAANRLSPRGIELGRDYFPRVEPADPVPPLAGKESGAEAAGTRRMLDHAAARALFDHPDRLLERIIFVDVRADGPYAAGHVPGAHHFDYYQPAAGLGGVLAACRTAETVVVYCRGGDCEDARLAVALLEQSGIPAGKLRIYEGGFAGWEAAGAPVETGERSSGTMKGGAP